jgi:hypothetical protein
MAQTLIESGRLYKVEQVREREFKDSIYRDQDIVVEIPGEGGSVRYLLLEASNGQVDDIAKLKLGSEVSVRYFVKTICAKSGKYEGRWFTHVVLLDIQPTIAQAAQAAEQDSPVDPSMFDENGETPADDLPF